MEEKQYNEQLKMLEDIKREERLTEMKERVSNSKHLISNKKKLVAAREQKQADFKQELTKKRTDYENELARRLIKVYSKPLNFEKAQGKGYFLNRKEQ